MTRAYQYLFTPLLLFVSSANAQNWILNGDFEDQNVCTEYSARCAPEAWFRLPEGVDALPGISVEPHSGKKTEALCIENFAYPWQARTFLYTRLACPLRAGEAYTFKCYVNTGHRKHFSLGLRASADRPRAGQPDFYTAGTTLLLEDASQQSKDKKGWRLIKGSFVAQGGEEYLLFGNFSPDPLNREKGQKDFFSTIFLLDELSLTAANGPDCPNKEARKAMIYDLNERHTNEEVVKMLARQESTDTLLATVPVVVTPDTIVLAPSVFIIPDIGFDFAKFTLRPEAQPVLRDCARQIRLQHPAIVRITGYTDDVGSDAYNLDLSLHRANAVRQWFVGDGFPESLFDIQGLGEARPVAPNDTDAGRQANRRVEIIFVQ